MTYVKINQSLGEPAIASFVDATDDDYIQTVPFGHIITATDPTYGTGEFIFLKGVASTAVGSWVKYNLDDATTSLLTTGDDGPVAVAMSACVADKAGWYQISGKAVGKVLAAFADNGDVYITGTAGSVDDSGTVLIHNARGASAIDTPSTGLAEIELSRPFVLMT